ncbi:MAG: 1,2-phenylacetyl-CoA epoxidase subunit PaaC [Longimicrobiales bacterium]
MTPKEVEGSAEQDAQARDALRDLILCLADSKRLLGMRYAQWILGAPELEAGIACASMAQDEWGHARLLYALLRDFGDDVDRLEHGREPHEYCSMAALDREPADWSELVALNALADTALSVQFEALRDAAYAPLRQRVEKLLEEERFHAAHGAAWARRLAGAGQPAREGVVRAIDALHPQLLDWFGPDSPRADLLVSAGIVDAGPSELRRRYEQRVSAMLAGLAAPVEPDLSDFDERRRRPGHGAPDAETIRRVRGDKNRAFLMD